MGESSKVQESEVRQLAELRGHRAHKVIIIQHSDDKDDHDQHGDRTWKKVGKADKCSTEASLPSSLGRVPLSSLSQISLGHRFSNGGKGRGEKKVRGNKSYANDEGRVQRDEVGKVSDRRWERSSDAHSAVTM